MCFKSLQSAAHFSLDDQFKNDCYFFDALCRQNDLQDIFRSKVQLYPPDLVKTTSGLEHKKYVLYSVAYAMKGLYTQFYCTNCKTITGLNCTGNSTTWIAKRLLDGTCNSTVLFAKQLLDCTCNNSTALIAKQLLGKFLFNLEIIKQQSKKNP